MLNGTECQKVNLIYIASINQHHAQRNTLVDRDANGGIAGESK